MEFNGPDRLYRPLSLFVMKGLWFTTVTDNDNDND